jgi:hypothetical protein
MILLCAVAAMYQEDYVTHSGQVAPLPTDLGVSICLSRSCEGWGEVSFGLQALAEGWF